MKQICLVLIIVCIAGCFGAEPQKTGKEGKPLPEFSILLTDSTTRLHSRDIPANKPFVLFVFSPFCPYCKAQTKKIIEDRELLGDIHFYFISRFALSDVKKYINEFQLDKQPNITVGLDSAGFVNDYLEAPGFPFIAIYGKNKTLNQAFLGKTYSSLILKAAEK
jgi:thiol-disulfide isomerase/thioredoxin